MLGADSAGSYAPQYVKNLFDQIPAAIMAKFGLLTPSIQVKTKELLQNVFVGFAGNPTLRDMALMSTADQLLTIAGPDFVDQILNTHFAMMTWAGQGGEDSNLGDFYDFVHILWDRRRAFIPISIEAPPVPSTPVLTNSDVNPFVELITPASSTSQQLVQPFICTQDVMVCEDGSFVARTEPGCNFPLCPPVQLPPTAGLTIALPNPNGDGTQQMQLPGTLLQTSTPTVVMGPGANTPAVTVLSSDNTTLILIGIVGLFLAMRN